MSNTVNNNIPFVPENTIDPAAGLNLSLLTLDAQVQLAVESVGLDTPPGSPAQGARYIVGTAPTGAWAGQANALAMWLDTAWRFYTARYALNKVDGRIYLRTGTTWAASGGATWGGITGTLSAQTDLQNALDAKAPLASPALTGTPTAPTATAGTNTTQIASTAFVQASAATKQPLDANLTALSGLAGVADRLPYFTGAGALSLATLTALARDLLDDTTQSGMQSTLGLVKQTSATDATAGALMTVGAFGLGRPVNLSNPDLNTLSTPGLYYCNSPVNGPGSNGYLLVESGSSVYFKQTYERVTSGARFTRQIVDGVPGAWQPDYTAANILGTVSQSSGVPTGAIIERGSNANGEYVRYADGTQICTCTAAALLVTDTAAGSGYQSANFTTYNYPASFIATPTPALSTSYGGTGNRGWASVGAINLSSITLIGHSFNNNGNIVARATLIGRWY